MTVPIPMLGAGPYGCNSKAKRAAVNVHTKEVDVSVNSANNSQEHLPTTPKKLGWISRQYKKLHRHNKTVQQVALSC